MNKDSRGDYHSNLDLFKTEGRFFSPHTLFCGIGLQSGISEMAPFEIASEATVTSSQSPEEKLTANGIDAKSSNGDKSKMQGQTMEASGTKEAAKVADVAQSEKISGAELKKRAKAEKAARRAQEKQGTQAPPPLEPVASAAKKPDVGKEAAKKGIAVAGPTTPGGLKAQHKRTGSTNNMHQRPMLSRPAQSPAVPPTPQPKKESKKVALFGHLYGQPRRTTIAGAGKDVHPTVLALGLQMSNYVICGSNARCVATLLAFKRVSTSFMFNLHHAHVPPGH